MSLFRRRAKTVHGDLLEVRERHVQHDCKVPGPIDVTDHYKGSLAHGSRWKCRRCGSVWELSNYYRFDYKWYRREDPTRDEFDRTHDAEGRRLPAEATQNRKADS